MAENTGGGEFNSAISQIFSDQYAKQVGGKATFDVDRFKSDESYRNASYQLISDGYKSQTGEDFHYTSQDLLGKFSGVDLKSAIIDSSKGSSQSGFSTVEPDQEPKAPTFTPKAPEYKVQKAPATGPVPQVKAGRRIGELKDPAVSYIYKDALLGNDDYKLIGSDVGKQLMSAGIDNFYTNGNVDPLKVDKVFNQVIKGYSWKGGGAIGKEDQIALRNQAYNMVSELKAYDQAEKKARKDSGLEDWLNQRGLKKDQIDEFVQEGVNKANQLNSKNNDIARRLEATQRRMVAEGQAKMDAEIKPLTDEFQAKVKSLYEAPPENITALVNTAASKWQAATEANMHSAGYTTEQMQAYFDSEDAKKALSQHLNADKDVMGAINAQVETYKQEYKEKMQPILDKGNSLLQKSLKEARLLADADYNSRIAKIKSKYSIPDGMLEKYDAQIAANISKGKASKANVANAAEQFILNGIGGQIPGAGVGGVILTHGLRTMTNLLSDIGTAIIGIDPDLSESISRATFNAEQSINKVIPDYEAVTTQEKFRNPAWYIGQIGEQVPYMAAMMLPSLAAGYASAAFTTSILGEAMTAAESAAAITNGSRAVALGSRAANVAATVGSGLTDWYMTSRMNGLDVYNDMIRNGSSAADAQSAMDRNNLYSIAYLPFSVVSMAPFFFRPGGKAFGAVERFMGAGENIGGRIGKFVGNKKFGQAVVGTGIEFIAEGGQEHFENTVQNYAENYTMGLTTSIFDSAKDYFNSPEFTDTNAAIGITTLGMGFASHLNSDMRSRFRYNAILNDYLTNRGSMLAALDVALKMGTISAEEHAQSLQQHENFKRALNISFDEDIDIDDIHRLALLEKMHKKIDLMGRLDAEKDEIKKEGLKQQLSAVDADIKNIKTGNAKLYFVAEPSLWGGTPRFIDEREFHRLTNDDAYIAKSTTDNRSILFAVNDDAAQNLFNKKLKEKRDAFFKQRVDDIKNQQTNPTIGNSRPVLLPESVDAEVSVQNSSLKKGAKKLIGKIGSALGGTKTVVLSDEQWNQMFDDNALGEENKKELAFYDAASDMIVFHEDRFDNVTSYHEGFHPVLDAVIAKNPEKLDELFSQLADISATDAKARAALDFAMAYNGATTQKKEAIVEYAANMMDNPSYVAAIKQWVVKLLDAVGLKSSDLGLDINNAKDLKSLIESVSMAFASGKQIKGINKNTAGEGGEAAPNFRKAIVGERAAKNIDESDNSDKNQKNLVKAKEMLEAGLDAKTIKLATGWESHKDGWKMELPDVTVKNHGLGMFLDMKDMAGTMLNRIVNFGELKKAYPEINDIQFIKIEDAPFGFGYTKLDGKDIVVASSKAVSSEADLRSGIIHELQHFIQSQEGFSRGLNIAKIREVADRALRDAGLSPQEVPEGQRKDVEYLIYNNTAAEVEARNAQARAGLTKEEKRKSLLSDTEDVNEEGKLYFRKSTRPIMEGKEKAPIFKVGRDIYEYLEKRHRRLHDAIEASDNSEESKNKIAKFMADEVRYMVDHQTKGGRSGIGWYTEQFQSALDDMATVFPELKNPGERSLFTMFVAIFSDGQKVPKNSEYAYEAYKKWRETGKVSTDIKGIGGDRTESFIGNLKAIGDLIDAYNGDLDAMTKDLLHKDTLKNFREKYPDADIQSSWPASMKVPYAAVVFGPKLGIFYSNLMGDEGLPTLDRWFSRTFNRLRGIVTSSATGKKGAEFDSKGRPIGLAAFKILIGKKNISDEQAISEANSIAKAYSLTTYGEGMSKLEEAMGKKMPSEKIKKDAYVAEAKKKFGGEYASLEEDHKMHYSGFWTEAERMVGRKYGSKAVEKASFEKDLMKKAGSKFKDLMTQMKIDKSANTIAKAERGLNDTPYGTADRQFMYEAIKKTKQLLAKGGIKLSIPDIQAALWYYEKQLYTLMGGKAGALGISYKDVFHSIAENHSKNIEGLTDKQRSEMESMDEVRKDAEVQDEAAKIEEHFDAGLKPVDINMRKKPLPAGAIDEDGEDYLFYHYGDIKGKFIDPKYFGRNLYTSDKRSQNVSYFYTRSGDQEQMVHGDPYVIRVPKDKVYYFNEDKLNLLAQAKKNFKADWGDRAFEPANQIDYMNQLALEHGYTMMVAKWGPFPFRAESIVKHAYDKELTEKMQRFGGMNKSDAVEGLESEIKNELSSKTQKMFAQGKQGPMNAFYGAEGDVQAMLKDPGLRKLVPKKLIDQYNEATGLQFRKAQETDKIISDAKANGTYMKAPNGKPTKLNELQWAQVRTEAFKKWFGPWDTNPSEASKVVDENGEPMVVYHGTTGEIIGDIFNGDRGSAAHFTSNPDIAEEFAIFREKLDKEAWGDEYDSDNKDFKNIIPAFISAKNIFDATNQDHIRSFEWAYEETPLPDYSWLEGNSYKIKSFGFDGYYDWEDYKESPRKENFAVFSPNQIKSATGNSGAFSTEDNRIQFRKTFEENSKDKIDEIKSDPEKNFGATFNLDGTQFDGKDEDVVTLFSYNVDKGELDNFSQFVSDYSSVADGNSNVKFGLFHMGDNKFSFDLNVVVDKSHRENTLKFARQNNQDSIFSYETMDTVKTGGSGESIITDINDMKLAAEALVKGGEFDFGRANVNLRKGENKFKKAVDLYYQVKDAKGGSLRRKLAQERRDFMEQNPDIKYIDDNISTINAQLEEKGLIQKEGDCP